MLNKKILKYLLFIFSFTLMTISILAFRNFYHMTNNNFEVTIILVSLFFLGGLISLIQLLGGEK